MGAVADAPDDGGVSLVERVRGQRVYFDANVFIYAREGEPALRDRVRPLFDLLDAGGADVVTSEMTLAEVLVVPYRLGESKVAELYERLLAPSAHLFRAPASADLWRAAARLRASTPSLRLPDALHAATAEAERCTLVVTGDKRLAKVSPVPAVLVTTPPAGT